MKPEGVDDRPRREGGLLHPSRRRFLGLTAGAAGFGLGLGLGGCAADDSDDGWNRGSLQHLLPTASHEAFNLKVSFTEAIAGAPILQVGDRRVPGERQDSVGRFWAFRIAGLEPDTVHTLRIHRGTGTPGDPLCDPWPLRTLPAPGSRPDRARIISFTCAGGPNLPIPPSIFHAFKPAAYRRRLFDRILENEPDLVIANGDHVYFDLPAIERLRENPFVDVLASFVRGIAATFDPNRPILGSPNEAALIAVGDDQIAGIHGVRFRSTPIFFITDDHDYFDNDDATPERVTFPPDRFHRSLRNTLQRLYFPEFIVSRPLGPRVPGLVERSDVALSTHFGEARYGDLVTALFYDCGGYLDLGTEAGLIPRSVESWLDERTRREDSRHLLHCPSHPMGWTAGKWREWYRDLLTSRGSLVEEVLTGPDGRKYMWQEGWWQQHQRLLRAISSQTHRQPVMVSGDLHALGITRIERSGELDLTANPVHSILSGPVGVGAAGWPSRARGVEPRTPAELEVTTLLDLEERNGFTILDFDRDRMETRLMRCPEGYVSPDRLEIELARRLELG